MRFALFKIFTITGKIAGMALIGVAALCASINAQTVSENATGTQNGFFYTFWKDSGDASITLLEDGRYTSQWGNSTNNWVGGKGGIPARAGR